MVESHLFVEGQFCPYKRSKISINMFVMFVAILRKNRLHLMRELCLWHSGLEMDVPVLRQTLAIFICIRLLGVVNFDYFLRQGCESPWFSLLPLLVVPLEELCMFHECLMTTEPEVLPMIFIEAWRGPPWGMLVNLYVL